MKTLMIVCLIGFVLFVLIMLYALFANESELDRMEEERWKHGEYKIDDESGSESGCGEAAINTGSERDHQGNSKSEDVWN